MLDYTSSPNVHSLAKDPVLGTMTSQSLRKATKSMRPGTSQHNHLASSLSDIDVRATSTLLAPLKRMAPVLMVFPNSYPLLFLLMLWSVENIVVVC